MRPNLNLAAIGNCGIGALVDEQGRIAWCCLPRFDGDPVFNALLGGIDPDSGFFAVDLMGKEPVTVTRAYVRNTAVLATTIVDGDGNAIEISDFAPRFRQFGRVFRPAMLVRRLRVLAGSPRIRIRLRPRFDYGAKLPQVTRGSNHCRYVSGDVAWRLTTDLPIAYVLDETPFLLEGDGALILGPDESPSDAPGSIAAAFHEQTVAYWQDWTRALSIPFDWQSAVIRAAITLKLSSCEETGGIIAAMTTSIPEAPHSRRNWDYRFCWLRDAYFVVMALNRLGATRTMEHYIRWISNIAVAAADGPLQPLYGLGLESELLEREAPALPGYRGMGPVRVGNLAYVQIQHDIYGAAILACAQQFFDERMAQPAGLALFERLERLGEHAARLWDRPDAGLWELRNTAHVHTFSAVMCWAACDRLARIAEHLGLLDRAARWRGDALHIHAGISVRAWNEERGAFASTFGGADMDASLLLLHEIDFLKPDDPRFVGTVEAIEHDLRRGNHLFRYTVPDDFGAPENAFNVCTFWFIDALSAIGRKDEARAMFEAMLATRNSMGLLSEDVDTVTGELWGNFPQTYSMVGLINSAMRLSRRWQEGF